jgi:hypothetical protein
MTWTKLGAEFFDDCADRGLSDAAVRTHVEAIGFVYRLESDGLEIQRHLLRRFAGSGEAEAAVAELVRAGFWRGTRKGWVLVHHAEVVRQSLAAQLTKRDRDRRAQEDKRDRDRKVRGEQPQDPKQPREGRAGVSAGVSADIAATQTDRHPDSFKEEVLQMLPGESEEAYEERFNRWEAARTGGGGAGDDPDGAFIRSRSAAAG